MQVAKLHKKQVKRQKKMSRRREEKLRKRQEQLDLERGKFGGSLDGRSGSHLPAIKEETPSIMSSSVVSSRAASLASVSLESVFVEDPKIPERKPTFRSYIKEDLTIDSLYFNGKKSEEEEGKKSEEEEEKRKEEERKKEKFNQQKYMIEQLKRRKSVKPPSDLTRRKSVFTKILGEAGYDRRFSNDLFPRLEDIRKNSTNGRKFNRRKKFSRRKKINKRVSG